MRVLGAVIYVFVVVCLLLAGLISPVLAEGCNCQVRPDIFDYYFKDLRDEPFMEDFPWQALSVEPIEGLTSCQVMTSLVTEDHPALETLPDVEDAAREYIWNGVTWEDFDDFEVRWRKAGCTPPAS